MKSDQYKQPHLSIYLYIIHAHVLGDVLALVCGM